MRELPPGLVKDLRQGQVAVFAGAGASNDAGLPTWSGLIEQLANDLALPDMEGEGKISLTHLTAVPQWYENRFGRKSLTEKIRDVIPRNRVAPSRSHQLLADLPCDLYYTTNYDTLLENALDEAGHEYDVVATEDDAKDHTGRERCQVRKIHGSIENASSIIVTRDDFLRYNARHTHLAERLRTDLATMTFLFVGYSLDDADFSDLYDRVFLSLAPFERRHYITVYDANAHQLEDLRRRGLEVIELSNWEDAGPDGALANFLVELCEATSDAVHIRAIFSGLSKGCEIPVVVPSYIHPDEQYQYFPRMDFDVARALENSLALLGVPSDIYADADVLADDPEAFLSRDVVLVGSPRGNEVTDYFFQKLPSEFPDNDQVKIEFHPGAERELVVWDGEERLSFVGIDPGKSPDDELRHEYALIARFENPWAPGKWIWVMAGLWGLGTQALADMFTRGTYRKLNWPAEGNVVSVLEIAYSRLDFDRGPYKHRGITIAKTILND